jgi:hypothetical protein
MRKLTATIQKSIAAQVEDEAQRKLVATAYRNADSGSVEDAIATVQAGTDAIMQAGSTKKPVSQKAKASAAAKAKESEAAKANDEKPVKAGRPLVRVQLSEAAKANGWTIEEVAPQTTIPPFHAKRGEQDWSALFTRNGTTIQVGTIRGGSNEYSYPDQFLVQPPTGSAYRCEMLRDQLTFLALPVGAEVKVVKGQPVTASA